MNKKTIKLFDEFERKSDGNYQEITFNFPNLFDDDKKWIMTACDGSCRNNKDIPNFVKSRMLKTKK